MNYKTLTIPQENSVNTIFFKKPERSTEQVDEEYFNQNENKVTNKLSTADQISDFFREISEIWKMEIVDYENLLNMFKSNELTAFNESFDDFEIANLAVNKTLMILDTPIIISELLGFFHKLIEIDQLYIDSLLRAGFLEALFKIYAEEKNSDCSIEVFKCASSIAKISIEHRDNVYSFFDTILKFFIKSSTVLYELFFLIAMLMEFEIDSSMFQTISSFLISKENVSIIISYLFDIKSYYAKSNDEENYDIQIKRETCVKYATCLWKLSSFPSWIDFFKANNLNKLFIELLLSKCKYIALYTAYSLEPLWKNKIINNAKVICSIINLLFSNYGSVIKIACSAIRYLILIRQNIIDPIRGIIIDRLLDLAANSKYIVRISAFVSLCNFLYHFQDSISYAIENGLINLIDQFFDSEDTYYIIPYALPILDAIFSNEELNGNDIYLKDFINKDGLKKIEEMLCSTNKDIRSIEIAELFLAKYNCYSDNFTYDEVYIE